MKKSNLVFKEVKTPIGVMVFGSSEKGLCLLDFKYRKSFPRILKRRIRDIDFRMKQTIKEIEHHTDFR